MLKKLMKSKNGTREKKHARYLERNGMQRGVVATGV
jgi:hypothetical protein